MSNGAPYTYTVSSILVVNICAPPISHPAASVQLPAGYTLTGGGAYDLWQGGAGNLLTASYPITQAGVTPLSGGTATGWAAAGKDHLVVSPAPLAVFAIGIQIIDSNNDPVPITQTVVNSTSATAAHPQASVTMTAYCTGGGAIDNYGSGVGNMLTGSWPMVNQGIVVGWNASGKDQEQSDPATVTVFAIGIQVPQMGLLSPLLYQSSSVASSSYPAATANVQAGNILVGGGAQDGYTGAGNILTASYPTLQGNSGWVAAGKDQGILDQSGVVTAYAIAFQGSVVE